MKITQHGFHNDRVTLAEPELPVHWVQMELVKLDDPDPLLPVENL